jgi:hypothetical protein
MSRMKSRPVSATAGSAVIYGFLFGISGPSAKSRDSRQGLYKILGKALFGGIWLRGYGYKALVM